MHGAIVFPGTAAPIPNPSALEWTDTRIRVVVPNGAAPGTIALSILEASLMRCGQVFTVFRMGGSDVPFEGGTAAVTAFLLNGSTDPLRVNPGDVVSISCDVTTHPRARTRVFVTQGGVTIADFGTLAGGGHRQHDFTAPRPAGPVTCLVHLTVGGPCGEVDRQRTITVAAMPHLRVAFLEVTQGLQDAAHTVKLVAGRTTGVRAYLTSGLGAFSYTGTAGEVPNVTGTLRVERGGVVIASIAAAGPVTVDDAFTDVNRSTTPRALVFVVPGALMDGDVTMRVSASVVGLPGFGTDTPGTSGSRTVHAERRAILAVVPLRMGLTNPAHPTAEPTTADWPAPAVGTQDRYPIGDADMLVPVPATGDVLSTNHFLGKKSGWEDAIDDLDDYADRYNNFDWIFACTVPAVNVTINGIAQPPTTDLGRSRTIGAAFSRRHGSARRSPTRWPTRSASTTRRAPTRRGVPEGIDANLPGATEPGVVGWRPSDGKMMPPRGPSSCRTAPPAAGSTTTAGRRSHCGTS